MNKALAVREGLGGLVALLIMLTFWTGIIGALVGGCLYMLQVVF